jgi:hypothetical protein
MNDQHPKLVIDSQLARRRLAQEFTSREDLDRKRRNSIKRPGNAKRDMSGFSFVLILMLLCEIAALQTDNPVFWLLVGPTPLALALASSRLFRYSRYRSIRRSRRCGSRSHYPSARGRGWSTVLLTSPNACRCLIKLAILNKDCR